jgi:hypothetical protein
VPSLLNEDTPEASENKTALNHFRIFVKFFEYYFSEQLELKSKIKAGIQEKIDFENLWMLFEGGETIYAPYREGGQILDNGSVGPPGVPGAPPQSMEKHVSHRRDMPQAYRVTATMGGVPLRKGVASRAEKRDKDLKAADRLFRLFIDSQDIPDSQRTKNRFSPLYVYCFYIDFNGNRYGTVTDIFIFRPHEGQIDIRSLEAYPLHYASPQFSEAPCDQDHGRKIEDMLKERGNRFIDLTAVSHMAYGGMSVGERREEVSLSSVL